MGLSDPAGSTTLARLSAARGEYESFQIVVQAPANTGLSHVNVAVTDLTSAGGHVISKNNVALFREHYVHVTQSSPDWGGSNRPLGAGWYADGLVPLVDPDTGSAPSGGSLRAASFNVQAGKNQPMWVDVFVPRTAAASQYSGSFLITSDQGTAAGKVALQVWNFTLPLRPALKSAFVTTQPHSARVARTLLRNKVSPLEVTPEEARDLMDNFGLSTSNLGFWSGADVSHCTMAPAPAVKQIRSAAAKYPAGLQLFDFVADEIGKCKPLYPEIRRWALALHQAGVRSLITMAPVPELFDDGSGARRSAVDIWVVLPERDAIAHALAKGDEIWSYNTLVQDPYSPKWEIDFAPLNFRIQPGFISQSLKLTGLLCWRVDMWPSEAWTNVNNPGKFSSNNYPGEGMLLYPGQAAGITAAAPSMRLKWIRDGVEDYEYVELLKQAGDGDWAIEIVRRVGRDWSHWTRDPEMLAAARQQLGQKLDALSPDAEPKRKAIQ
ncbi:MAG: hypothetical protein DMG58_09475 [Acidobacteria bacterium]|nr:MAG: hypothetical protein DMG58_09475 [Acidobacteriota bacterium]